MQSNQLQLSHWHLRQSMPAGVEPACPFQLVERLLYPEALSSFLTFAAPEPAGLCGPESWVRQSILGRALLTTPQLSLHSQPHGLGHRGPPSLSAKEDTFCACLGPGCREAAPDPVTGGVKVKV